MRGSRPLHRLTQACDHCRARKTKQRKRGPRPASTADSAANDLPSDSPDHPLDDPNQRTQHVEALLPDVLSPGLSHGHFLSPYSPSSFISDSTSPLPSPPDSSHVTQSPAVGAAVGPSRQDPTLAQSPDNTHDTHCTPPALFASIYHDLNAAVANLGLDLSMPALARKCVAHFFDCLYPIMPIVYRPKIELGLCLLQPGIERREVDIQVFALTMSVCAIAAAIIPSTIFSEGSLVADKFYRASKRSLDLCRATELEQPTSASIATRYFQSGYTHSVGRPRTSWDELEAAIAIAQGMQLHDEAAYTHMEEVENQLCRRLFWVLFTGDKSAGILGKHHITLGRYLLEGGITVQYSKSLEGEDQNLPQGSTESTPALVTGFNFNQDLWRAAYSVLLAIDTLRERYSAREAGEERVSTMPTPTELSRLGSLYIAFETSLSDVPRCLRAHPTLSLHRESFRFGQESGSLQLSRPFALQRINLHVSYQSLRLVILQAMTGLLDAGIPLWHIASPLWPKFLPTNVSPSERDFDPYLRLIQSTQLHPVINNEVSEFQTNSSGMSTMLLQKVKIAEEMLYILHTSSLENLRLNGESCVEKIRLVGASMLELIDHHADSPLANIAREFGDLYPHILAHMESKASDSLSENT
ncbi:hypothetical protein VE00_08228 [Pseudogymnoascus sp. WSF 3629]|nr:hypothetical protein VE00_08228 [Pseudogymnoascus sp. WSF 3629]